MTDNPLVSVKMLTYNHVPYIAQAIEGVLSQKTDFPFELVIGEDCSTDGTREIVFRYAEAHPDVIRVVTSESNVGMKANGRRTTQACRGKYLAWCEGDDYWHRDDKLQLQVAYLEAHDDCTLVHSDCDFYVQSTGEQFPSWDSRRGLAPHENPTVADLLRGKYAIRTCTACARLDVIRDLVASDRETYGPDARFLMGDTQLWAGLISRGKTHFFPESLATYRFLPESASRSRSYIQQQRFHCSAADLRLHIAKRHGLDKSEVAHYQRKLAKQQLILALVSADKELGETGYRSLDTPALRDKILFLASRNIFLNRIVLFAWRVKRRVYARHQRSGITGLN